MRDYLARWTAAEAALAVAWAAFAVGLLADALARDVVGSAVLATFAAWQLTHLWSRVHGREALQPPREGGGGGPVHRRAR
jgi:hypothetical protein